MVTLRNFKSMYLEVVTIVMVGASLAYTEDINAGGREVIKPIENRSLKMQFIPHQSEYLVGEPVFVDCLLENYGNEVEYWSMSEADYDIIKEDGTKLTPGWTQVVDYIPRPFVEGVGDAEYQVVHPGKQSESWEIDVLDMYGIGCHMEYYLPAGDYRICSRLFASDTVLIRVVAPANSQDSGAVHLITALLDEIKNCLDSRETRRTHAAIIQNFPNSRLRPKSLNALMAWGAVDHSEETRLMVQEYARQLILQFPTHPYSGLAVFKLDLSQIGSERAPEFRQALQQMLSRKWREDYREQIQKCLKALESR